MQHFIGKDLHTRYQVVAWIDEATGEIRKRRLEHKGEEVRKFYAQFPRGAVVGIEATFPALWFERLLAELGHELWVGDAARIRAHEVRDQKHDPRDAENILDLLRTGRFPRIGVPTREERDLRQLLVHRMKQVRARTQVKNQLHALAISQGVCRKRKLWSARGRAELEKLPLLPWRGGRGKNCWSGWTAWTRRCGSWTGRWKRPAGSARRWCCCAPIRAWGWVGFGLCADGGTH